MELLPGTIICHFKYGFGIILEQIDAYVYKVHFNSNTQKEYNMLKDVLKEVDEDIIYFAKEKFYLYSRSFSYNAKMKGEKYFQQGRVREILCDDNRKMLLSKVSGSNGNVYDTKLSVDSNGYSSNCNCPVGYNCKHGYATILELSEAVFNLNKYYEEYLDNQTYKTFENKDLGNEEYKRSLQNFLALENFKCSEREIEYIADNHENLIKLDPVGFAKVLEKEIIYGDFDTEEILLNILEKLPDIEYFKNYVSNRLELENYYYNYGKKAFLESQPKYIDLNEAGMKYFTVQYYINKNIYDETFDLHANLNDPLGMSAAYYKKHNDNQGKLVDNFIDGNNKGVFFEYLKKEVDRLYGKEIEKEKKEFDEDVEKIRYERKCRHFLSEIDDLSNRLTANTVSYKKSEKINLEPVFNFEGGCYVSFKVGFEKKYVIKNINLFIRQVLNNETYAYGKNLKFCHTISNFDDESKKILEYLMMLNETTLYAAKKELRISKTMAKNMLLELKGHIIEINGSHFTLTLDKKSAEVYINKDYELQLKIKDISNDIINPPTETLFNPLESSLILLEDTLFLLDKKRLNVSIIEADLTQSQLYRFAALNHGIDTRISGSKFKEKIFAKAHRDIKVADEIAKDLHVGELKIEAYFDFENDILSVKEKLFLDNEQIEKSNIASESDLFILEQFDDLLSSFGFVQGIIKDDNEIMNFLRSDLSMLNKLCDVYLSDSLKRKQIISFDKAVIRVEYGNDLMQAFMAPSEYSQEELSKIYYALKKKKKYVLLSNDRIIDLDNEEAKDFEKAVKDLNLDPDKLYEEKQISLVESLKAFSHEKSCHVDEYLNSMIEDIKNFKEKSFKFPKIDAKLRTYQEEGVKWLSVLSSYGLGGILADDMGLGKTIEIITLITADKVKKPSLVICPTSVIYNWQNEFSKFAPEENVVRIYGNATDRHKTISSINKNKKVIYITSYDSMSNDIELYKKINFNYAILDEAQNIKNLNAQRSKNAKIINADHKFALTGTPIENNLMDLWSIFDFVIPGYFENAKDFQSMCSNEGFTNQVAKRIAPFLLRRTKENVLKDLPDKYEHIVTAEMTKEQRLAYDAYVNEARKALEEGGALFDVLPFITHLRQICVSPELFIDKYEGGSGKLEMLITMVKEYISTGHRILIFSQFVSALEVVSKIFDKEKIGYFMLTGNTSAKERIKLMEEFNSNSNNKVFLISLKAGGTGLNLTGADVVIHLDPWWNTAAENQASDRAHRIGQTRNVEIVKLVCENSIEERVIELQNLKKDIIDKVIAKDDSAVLGAKLEDIAFILK